MDIFFRIILTPINLFNSEHTRIYWPYLLTSFVLAIVVVFLQVRKNKKNRVLKRLFHRRYCLNHSAFIDYKFFLINTMLFAAGIGFLSLSIQGVTKFFHNILIYNFGMRKIDFELGFFSNVIVTILLWLSLDFGRFLAHYLLHRVAFLWEFHKFHHSAEYLNPITDYRVHPVEALMFTSFGSFFAGLVMALLIYLFPNGTQQYFILNINAGVFIFNLYANLRHSHIWLSFPTWLSNILISPAMHQIHHGKNPDYHNKNLGIAFALWDKIFGCLYIPKHKEKFAMGLENERREDFSKLSNIYFLPFKRAWKVIFH